MDFFGIGTWEILLILLIAFLVVGPQRLPEVAVQLARAIRQLRRYAGQLTGQLRREFDELAGEYEELKRELADLRRQVDREAAATSRGVAETARETRRSLPSDLLLENSTEPPPEDKAAGPSVRP